MDSETSIWIIRAMGVGMGSMAIYIVRLHLEIKGLWEARVSGLEDQIAMLAGDDE